MTVSVISDAWSFTFQLTSSQGGWRIRKGWYHLHILFNSHPHKEDDQTIHRQCPQYYLFNSHPHKEDDEVIWATSCDIAFSTHILTRRMTHLHIVCKILSHFSTHILTRRMTGKRYKYSRSLWFSTHILTRRMTKRNANIEDLKAFQLTSSQGGWRVN